MKYKKHESDLVCNMCNGTMKHIEIKTDHAKPHEITHAWVCDNCPNMQFECYGNKDLRNLAKYLRGQV